jgi:signal transduction histidine kinase
MALSLILVVGIMGVLLAGTVNGLFSYRSTMKSIDRKLHELRSSQKIQESVSELSFFLEGKTTQSANAQELARRVKSTQETLRAYQIELDDTVQHGGDSDRGYDERGLADSLDKSLQQVLILARERDQPRMSSNPADLQSADYKLLDQTRRMQLQVTDLRDHIHTDMTRSIAAARLHYRSSLVFVSATCIVGVALAVWLTRLAQSWILYPIRDLHDKVVYLAQGNFDSRIAIKTNDEMEDLAVAFNDMAERLQAIYRDLARQVNERSRQLVRSERLAGVGFLAAGVAHEINNPLASIAFCGESLQRRIAELLHDQQDHPDYPTVMKYLDMIQEEAFRCKEITQKLLEFSRVGERQREMTDLVQLMQSVLDMVHHLQSYKGKSITFNPVQQPRVFVNAPEIKSVILNLVVNALENMDEGGKLTITLDVEDDFASMYFVDTGIGMSDEVLENIFEPFYTRSRTGKGTGLGLSISHRVISQHGGEIEATSEGENKGSTFVVRLPLSVSLPFEQPQSMAA